MINHPFFEASGGVKSIESYLSKIIYTFDDLEKRTEELDANTNILINLVSNSNVFPVGPYFPAIVYTSDKTFQNHQRLLTCVLYGDLQLGNLQRYGGSNSGNKSGQQPREEHPPCCDAYFLLPAASDICSKYHYPFIYKPMTTPVHAKLDKLLPYESRMTDL